MHVPDSADGAVSPADVDSKALRQLLQQGASSARMLWQRCATAMAVPNPHCTA